MGRQSFGQLCGKKRRRGFALRELLALMAVGMFLAGMSSVWSEAFQRKRDAIRCLTNGRQMMQAFALYADDHRGLLPPNEDAVVQGHTWIALIGGTANGTPQTTNEVALQDPRINLLAPYVSDWRVWKCPADRSTVVFGGKRVRTVRSVSMNLAVGTACPVSPGAHNGVPSLATHGSWLDGVHGHRRGTLFRTFGSDGDFVRPSETFVFMDEHPPSLNDGVLGTPGYDPKNPNLSTVRWVDYPAVYHGQAGGVTFADGHAEIHRWKGLQYPATGFPSSSVTQANRDDWEWLGMHATQSLK